MAQTIPTGWEEKTLGEICEFRNGFAFESKKLKNIKDKNNNVPVIKIGNLQPNETVSLKESQYSHYDNSLSNFLIKKNDILFAMSGATVGKVSLFLSEEKALLNQRVGLIRLKEERTSLKFLLYQLYDKNFYDYCQRTSGGAAQPNISLKQVAHYQIKHPPLTEQQRIVAKLDEAFEAIDKVKANAEQNLTNAKELFESALNKAFTENTEGWEEKTLGDILDKGSSNLSANKLNDGSGLYPVYGASGLAAKVDFYQQEREYLAIIKDGAGVGRVYHYGPKTSVLGTLQYLHPKQGTNIRFAYYYLQSIDFAKYYQGAAIPHIYYRDYKNEKLVLPPLQDQQKIVEKLDALQEQTKQLEQIYTQKIKECDELKQSILQKAFRGEL